MAIEIKNRDFLIDTTSSELEIKSTLGDSPSSRYTSVLENTFSAIQDYWRNKDFVDGEDYAEVTVNKNISTIENVSDFMNYLAEKDETLKPAEELGSWVLTTGQPKNVNVRELENPKTQPETSQVSAPSAGNDIRVKYNPSEISSLIASQPSNTLGRKSFSSIVEDLKKQGR